MVSKQSKTINPSGAKFHLPFYFPFGTPKLFSPAISKIWQVCILAIAGRYFEPWSSTNFHYFNPGNRLKMQLYVGWGCLFWNLAPNAFLSLPSLSKTCSLLLHLVLQAAFWVDNFFIFFHNIFRAFMKDRLLPYGPLLLMTDWGGTLKHKQCLHRMYSMGPSLCLLMQTTVF